MFYNLFLSQKSTRRSFLLLKENQEFCFDFIHFCAFLRCFPLCCDLSENTGKRRLSSPSPLTSPPSSPAKPGYPRVVDTSCKPPCSPDLVPGVPLSLSLPPLFLYHHCMVILPLFFLLLTFIHVHMFGPQIIGVNLSSTATWVSRCAAFPLPRPDHHPTARVPQCSVSSPLPFNFTLKKKCFTSTLTLTGTRRQWDGFCSTPAPELSGWILDSVLVLPPDTTWSHLSAPLCCLFPSAAGVARSCAGA